MLLTPQGHQLFEASHLTGLPGKRGLLLSETGTGKTVTLGLVAERVNGPCLWLTEKSVMTQTLRELEALGLRAAQLDSKEDRAGVPQVIVTTHALARTRLDAILARGPWPLLIIDEAQIVGGGGVKPHQQTYQAVKALSKDAERVIASTAEPVGTTHLLDLWALGDAIKAPGWPSQRRIGELIMWEEWPRVAGGRIYTERIPVGITEAGKRLLFDCVARIGIRTALDEVVEGIPSIERIDHAVSLTATAQQAYANVSSSGLHGHQTQTRISRDGSALIPYVLRLLAHDYRQHRSVVIYTEQFDLLDPLQDALTNAGQSHVRLTGQEPAKARQEALDLHRSGQARCLIGTKALEAGLNVQHASLLVSLVQSYNPAREKQREGRLRRLGSPHSSITHAVVYPDVPLEGRRRRVLEQKAALSEQLATYLAERRPN